MPSSAARMIERAVVGALAAFVAALMALCAATPAHASPLAPVLVSAPVASSLPARR